MNVDMTKNLTYAFCNSDGGPAIAVQKRGSGSERFSAGLETEYWFQIGRETRGGNNARGDNKVDIKVDNKVDNNAWDDTVNDTVKHPQTRTRTTTPYNIRTRPVQHPYKTRRCRLGRVGFFHGSISGPISGPLNGSLSGLKSGSLSGLKSGLNETDSKLIGFIQSNPSVTIQELQAMLNLSRNGVRKALGRLKATGWLRRIGPDKGGRWEVVKK